MHRRGVDFRSQLSSEVLLITKIASAEVLLIVLCIMNVLSALFVEMALQIKDRDLLIQAP